MSDIINIDDLYGNQREIAEVIGIDNYIKLSKYFGGEDSLYIQKYSELAKMYNLSTRYIRMICKLKEDF